MRIMRAGRVRTPIPVIAIARYTQRGPSGASAAAGRKFHYGYH